MNLTIRTLTSSKTWPSAGLGCVLAALVAFPIASRAQDRDWAVGSGQWNVGGNWSGGAVPTGAGNATINNSGTAIVGVGVSGTTLILNIGSNTVGNLLRVEGGYLSTRSARVGGSASSSAIVSSGTWENLNAITVGTSGTGQFLMSGGLVTTGRTLLAEINGSAGTWTMNSGTWRSTIATVVGSRGKGTVTLNGGYISSGSTTIGEFASYSGFPSSSAGSSVTVNSGTWAMGAGLRAINDSGLTVNGGLASVSGGVALGRTDAASTSWITVNGGTFSAGSVNTNLGASFTIANGGVVSVGGGSGTLTVGSTYDDNRVATLNIGSYDRTSTAGTLEAGQVFLRGSSVLNFNQTNAITWTTPIEVSFDGASPTVYQRGTGTTTLSNTYLRAVGHVSQGTLIVSGGTAIVVAGSMEIGVDGNATLRVTDDAFVITQGARVGASAGGATGSVLVESGTWTSTSELMVGYRSNGSITQSGGFVNILDTVYIASGTSQISGVITVNGGTWAQNGRGMYVGPWTAGSGTLNVNGGLVDGGEFLVAISGTGTVNLAGGTLAATKISGYSGGAFFNFNGGTLRASNSDSSFVSGIGTGINIRSGGAVVDSNGYNIGITSAFTGSGALKKIGSGTLTLTSAGTYTGGTTVRAGTLLISNVGNASSVLGTGDVTVEENGKLAGVGTVLGDTYVAGTLAPGNSPGEMNFAGDLFLESTAVVQMELASAISYDQITVGGLLTYDGTLSLTFLGGYFPEVGATFALFEAGSVASGSQFDSIIFGESGYAGTLDYTTGILTVTAVPEPTAAALLVLGGVGLLARRRRR